MTQLQYKKFNEKYNKRDSNGVILEYSIITLNGEVIFRGTADETDTFMDEKCSFDQIDGHWINTFEGEEVVPTNVCLGNTYGDFILGKLRFELIG